MTRRRSPILAALASLTMPGLGQLYNGQGSLAVLWFVGYWAVAVLYTLKVITIMTSPDPAAHLSSPLGLLLVMGVIWLAGVVQAIFAALDRPDFELRPYNRGLVYAGAYLLAYVALPLAMAIPLAGWTSRLKGGARVDGDGVAALLEGVTRSRSVGAGQPNDLKIDIPDPDAAAAAATTVLHVTLVGGPDGGIYDATSKDAICTYRADSTAPSWAGLYANPADTASLTALQFRIPISDGETNDFQLSVNRGTGTESRSYVVEGRRPRDENGKGRASVARRGEGVLIRVDATTEQGVRIEAVVQCRKVGAE